MMLKRILFLAVLMLFGSRMGKTQDLDDEHVVTATAANGTCFCQVSAPSHVVCSEFESGVYEDLAAAILRIDSLSGDLTYYEQISVQLKQEVLALNIKVSSIEATLVQIKEERNIIISGQEFYALEAEILSLVARLADLEANKTVNEEFLSSLKVEITQITAYLGSLEEVDSTILRELEAQVEELKKKLDECENTAITTTQAPPGPCNKFSGVSEAYTHKAFETAAGVWMRDCVKQNSFVYKMQVETSSRYGRYLYESPDLSSFEDSVPPSKKDLYPSFSNYYFESNGHIVYNGSLYAQRYNSPSIYRIDVGTLAKTGEISIPSVGYKGAYPYEAGYYTDIDMAGDEKGIWVIYATSINLGNIVISKIDEENMAITNTFETNYPKRDAGNCIMICGVMYCTNSATSHSASFSYFYDTTSGDDGIIDLPFDNKYGKLSSLDYNPRDQKLYAWDNTLLTSYETNFANESP